MSRAMLLIALWAGCSGHSAPTSPPDGGEDLATSPRDAAASDGALSDAALVDASRPPPPDGSMPIASITQIVTQMPAGSWSRLTGTNHMSDVFAAAGAHAIVTAWGGGGYGAGAMWIWGGGHVDYGGNEIYKFDLATVTWSRVTNPSPYVNNCGVAITDSCVTTDGTPTAKHSYDGVAYIPSTGKLFLGGAYPYYNAMGNPAASKKVLYDPLTGSWPAAPSNAFTGSVMGTAYDGASGLLLVSDGNYLAAFDPVGNQFTHLSGSNWAFGEGALALDPDDHLALYVGGSAAYSWDLSGVNLNAASGAIPENQKYPTTMKGGSAAFYPTTASNMGLDYDPAAKLFVGWGGDGDVWTLDPKTKEWSKVSTSGAAPTNASPNGIYGRWWYLPEYDAFMGFNDPSGDPWLFKLP
jgi:hypothetical protein